MPNFLITFVKSIPMKQFEIHSLADIKDVAVAFLNEYDHRKIIAFDAEMGTGKTTFILALLQAMGIEDPEGSPTYSLVNAYESVKYGKINHLDVYRLNDEHEAFDIGIEEMLYDGSYCFIEWPEKIENLLPDNTIWVYIRKNEHNHRIISVEQ